MQSESRQEPGCLRYGFYTSLEDPDEFVAVEEWESAEALQRPLRRARASPVSAPGVGGLIGRPARRSASTAIEQTNDFPDLDGLEIRLAPMQAAAQAGALRGGIDLGGTKIQAAIVGPQERGLRARRGARRRPRAGPQDVADADGAGAGRGRGGRRGADRLARRGRGRLARATRTRRPATSPRRSNLPGWSGSFPLGATLSDALGAPVRVANDVDVATNAEFKLGAGKPYQSLLGVFWGTGVGGGVILDGKRWLGRGAAGEIGHMVVEARRRALSRAGGAAAWRPTPGAARWRRRRGASTPTGRRRSCSRSWRSTAATG